MLSQKLENMSLLVKHFPSHSKFHKIFNRGTIKTSYSCISDMKITINSRNHKITNPPLKTELADA